MNVSSVCEDSSLSSTQACCVAQMSTEMSSNQLVLTRPVSWCDFGSRGDEELVSAGRCRSGEITIQSNNCTASELKLLSFTELTKSLTASFTIIKHFIKTQHKLKKTQSAFCLSVVWSNEILDSQSDMQNYSSCVSEVIVLIGASVNHLCSGSPVVSLGLRSGPVWCPAVFSRTQLSPLEARAVYHCAPSLMKELISPELICLTDRIIVLYLQHHYLFCETQHIRRHHTHNSALNRYDALHLLTVSSVSVYSDVSTLETV